MTRTNTTEIVLNEAAYNNIIAYKGPLERKGIHKAANRINNEYNSIEDPTYAQMERLLSGGREVLT